MRKALGLAAALVVVSLISVAVAQQRRVPSPALEQVNRALLEGRYDEVPALAASLSPQDPQVVALIARASIARGKYDEALKLLQPVAQISATSDAALEYGLLLQMLNRDEATPILRRIADVAARANDPYELARAGRALRALNQPYEANQAYRDATSMLPRDAALQTAYGDLFLERYQNGDASQSYQAALRIDPKYAPALFGMARALSDEDPPQAMKLTQQVLEINPAHADAYVFIAEHATDAGKRDDARKAIDKALAINPASLSARALLGGLEFVEDKPALFEAEIAKVMAIAPKHGEAYRVAGELAARNYRYDEAVALMRRGVALDPQNPRLLSDFGTHLLRTGDEPGARAVLEQSFKIDGFNPVTKNLLVMMDNLDTFAVVKDDTFTIKLPKDEAPVLGDLALALAHQSIDQLSKRYQFTPKGPILIEIFNKHDDFAVRSVGLPGMVGALGACFGRVVTMDSPKANTPSPFQWEATLWHELAHVITLQMSNYRLPRWLSEGISTYEEKLHRPEWARGQDMQFASMMNEKQVIKLTDLNSAFTDPRLISIAYFQASLLVEHIVKTYGDEGLHRLLREYGKGLETDAALKAALNTDFASMQSGFDQTLEGLFGELRKALDRPDEGTDLAKMPLDQLKAYASSRQGSFGAQMVLGDRLQDAGDLDGAVKAFELAAKAVPIATGDDSPRLRLADIALERKDNARALTELQAAMKWDFDNVALARRVSRLMKDLNVTDATQLRDVNERIVAVDPYDAEAHTVLGRLAMQANQPAAAVREFKAVVALKPVDQAAAHTDLAESYLKNNQRAEARRQTLAALEVAPSYERAQNLLLELAEGRP